MVDMTVTEAELLIQVNTFLSYDQETGLFTWKLQKGRGRVGVIAGCFELDGYRQIRISKKLYKAHRLAFLVMTGRLPEGQIDHIDGDRANNAWGNLRECSNSENQQNTICTADRGLPVGVHMNGQSFVACIGYMGRKLRLGAFPSAEEAGAAYLEAKSRLHTFNPVPRTMKDKAA